MGWLEQITIAELGQVLLHVLTCHSHALNGIAVSVLSVPITQGMMCSAHAVQLKLASQNILERAFAEHPVSLCGGAVTYVLKKLKGKTP